METIEQLKQDNAKLQERLNNAAKFFRDQKVQIETLTNEVKEKTELALDYRNQIKTLTEKVDTLEHDEECFNSILEAKEKEISELKSLNDESINAGVELGKEIAELQAKIHQMENNSISQKDFDDEVKRLNQTISECKKSYDERVEDISKLQMQVVKLEKDNQDIIQTSEQYKSAYTEVKSKLKEYDDARKVAEEKAEMWQKNLRSVTNTTNEEVKKVTIERDEWIVKYRELEKSFDNESKRAIALYNELKEKYDKLSQLYDHLENEKMAYAADFDILQQKYNDKVAQEEANLEIGTDLINTLQDIWTICDNKLNPKPKEEKKTNKRIDTINKVKDSTGSQFMSDATGMNI